MGEAIGLTLGQAVGVAISPIPVVAVILMLFSPRARMNGPAFVAGWIAGLTMVATLVLILINLDLIGGDNNSPSDAAGLIKVLLGTGLMYLAVAQWQKRPKPGEEAVLPKWMSAIDSFTPARAFGLGTLLSGLNPKNLGLTIAVTMTIAQMGLANGEEVGALVVFVLIGSATVLAPVAYYLLAGASAERTLATMKDWLGENNHTVMAVLFLVLGAKVLGDGISILAQ